MDIFIKRVKNQNNKIKDITEIIKIDIKRERIYRFGVALESDTIPNWIKDVETKKKEILKIGYPFFRCFVKGHKTT